VAHRVGGTLGVASHAGGGLGELHALVRHTSDSVQAVGVSRASFGSGEMASAGHASTHRLAHRVVSASSLGHWEFGPFSRAAELEVHSALGHGGEGGAVGIAGAGVHVLGLDGEDLFHHSAGAVVHHVGSGQTDEESHHDSLHGCFGRLRG